MVKQTPPFFGIQLIPSFLASYKVAITAMIFVSPRLHSAVQKNRRHLVSGFEKNDIDLGPLQAPRLP